MGKNDQKISELYDQIQDIRFNDAYDEKNIIMEDTIQEIYTEIRFLKSQ